MSKRTVYLEPNKRICDAEGCLAIAEQEINVPVGQIGEISLSVCNKCKPKFNPKRLVINS
jgi:hypothetical protein